MGGHKCALTFLQGVVENSFLQALWFPVWFDSQFPMGEKAGRLSQCEWRVSEDAAGLSHSSCGDWWCFAKTIAGDWKMEGWRARGVENGRRPFLGECGVKK